jgi:enterochelin esterase-like enzyme
MKTTLRLARAATMAAFAMQAAVGALAAQTPGPAVPAAAPAAVRSPEVHADRRITFRVAAPNAKAVALSFDEGAVQTHAMARDAAGVWSVTVGPVAPEIYIYNFVVDGLRVLDLANTNLKSGVALASNVVEVPGTPARFDEEQNVPRGSVNVHTYRSGVQNATRGLYVYVPDEYYASPTRRYPVLYLYHGGGGYEGDWVRDGRAGVILDNLIASGKSVPMIIVMPNNTLVAPPSAGRGAGPAAPGPPASAATLARELLTDIIPFVEKRYRTTANRESRAIAGLSAGGGTAFPTGLNNLNTFAYVAQFSSGMFGGTGANTTTGVSADVIVPGLFATAAAKSRQLKLLYMSCGTEDPRMPFQKQTAEDLKKNGYNPVFMSFAGAHQWKVWRYSLNDLAPRLFR